QFQLSSNAAQVRPEGNNEAVGAVFLQVTSGGTLRSGSTITLSYSAIVTNLSGRASIQAILSSFPAATAGKFSVSTAGNTITLGASADIDFAIGDALRIGEVRLNAGGQDSVSASVSVNPTSITVTPFKVAVASAVSSSLVATIGQ